MAKIPTPTNVTGLASYSQYLNTVTDNLFWPLALFTFSVILFVSLVYVFGAKRAMASTFFAGTLVALLMRVQELITDGIIYLFIIGLGFSVFWIVVAKDN